MTSSLVIVGANAGAATRCAVRAGFQAWCFDRYARRDLQKIARTTRCTASTYPAGLLNLIESARAPDDAKLLFVGGLENQVGLLEAMSFDRELLGSGVQAVHAARDPRALTDLPAHVGLKFPKVRDKASLTMRAGRWLGGLLGARNYLIKPCNSFAGAGVRPWSALGAVPSDHYLQQLVRGAPIGVVYRGDGWSCHLLGVTEMIVGEPAFGARGFGYVGNVGPTQLSEPLRKALMHLGVALTQRYDLRGLFGVDGIMDFSGAVWPIEINPRFTDSVEVLENAQGVSLLTDSTSTNQPSSQRRGRSSKAPGVAGKAVVRANADVVVPDLFNVLNEHEVTEAPEPGRGVRRDGWVCTVHARAATADQCRRQLSERARMVFDSLRPA